VLQALIGPVRRRLVDRGNPFIIVFCLIAVVLRVKLTLLALSVTQSPVYACILP
jgi:hypothetical protein